MSHLIIRLGNWELCKSSVEPHGNQTELTTHLYALEVSPFRSLKYYNALLFNDINISML